MKIQFKQQRYQLDAVDAVVKCFEGQIGDVRREVFDRFYDRWNAQGFEGMNEFEIFSNPSISLTADEWLHNIQGVQKSAGLPLSNKLDSRDLTIEMETGTGKTYVYIRTIFELSARYNWNKFIIVVPSIAIREGVYKSLQITAEHFAEIYGKRIQFHIYDNKNKSNLNNIKHFASNNELQVIVMNYQAFNATEEGKAKWSSEASRKIFQDLDVMGSYRPIDLIKGTKPIIIIDEPQRLWENTEKILQNNFNPLFTLRYSATHKKDKEFHKVYRLDALDAINQKLVKKIRAFGYEETGNAGNSQYIFIDRIEAKKDKKPVAYIEIEVKQNSGIVRKIIKCEIGDNLYDTSNQLKQYEWWKISNINARDNIVEIENQISGFEVGKIYGGTDPVHLARLRIRHTIDEHLKKEEKLFEKWIKVLSLFFIDEVAKYRAYDENGEKIISEYEKIFEEEYANLVAQRKIFTPKYNEYLSRFAPANVHGGYFSVDKKTKQAVNTSERSDNIDEYQLIMKDKEKLLSFEEPMRFIFSHSALSEGWDNPNVFQICMLRPSNSDMKRRQEVGRGLRICVDKDGRRMDSLILWEEFIEYNCLTVIAAESYENFATGLQSEIMESMANRPVIITEDILQNYQFITNNGNNAEPLMARGAVKLFDELVAKNYLDNGKVTEHFADDVKNGNFALSENFAHISESIKNLLQESHSLKNFERIVEKWKKSPVEEKNMMPNANFYTPEFQELWNLINYKSAYEVQFDSKKLIEKCVESIDMGLNIKETNVRISIGEQNMSASQMDLQNQNMMHKTTICNEKLRQVDGFVKYDIISEITKETGLTRRTIAAILSAIKPSEFEKYKYSPQAFIKEVSRIIKMEKSRIAEDGIVYYKVDAKIEDAELGVDFEGNPWHDIMEVKKHIYDYLKWDSEIEKKFAEDMEKWEVKVYAKLPKIFKIPTPIGNYNPDWAIVLEKNNTKYIYFIAETKWSVDEITLREKEKMKIEYARKHFKLIESEKVKYDVVDNYNTLESKVQ